MSHCVSDTMLAAHLKSQTFRDVRPHNLTEYLHKLGVCIQPIYMHAEFPLFIQFFEHWLARGATKFYIYRHSHSKEVRSDCGSGEYSDFRSKQYSIST